MKGSLLLPLQSCPVPARHWSTRLDSFVSCPNPSPKVKCVNCAFMMSLVFPGGFDRWGWVNFDWSDANAIWQDQEPHMNEKVRLHCHRSGRFQ